MNIKREAGVIFLAGAIVTGECLGHEENKHIELRQYRATPELVSNAWDIVSPSTATVTTVSSLLLTEQFT
jgi:hypothetical protein